MFVLAGDVRFHYPHEDLYPETTIEKEIENEVK